MMRTITILIVSLLLVQQAQAEQDEKAVGVTVGLMLPNYESKSNTSFALASAYFGVNFSYSITNNFWLTSEFGFTTLGGKTDGYTTNQEGHSYTGTLNFDTRMYQPSIGIKYLVYPRGGNWEPYVSASIGYVWNTYHNLFLSDEQGEKYDLEIEEFAEDSFVAKVGISFNYRMMNTLVVGINANAAFALGKQLYRYSMSLPEVYLAYYWP